MAASAPISDRHSWLDDCNSMLVSAACHFVILIVLGLITVAGTAGGQGDSIVMMLGGHGGGPAAGAGDDNLLPDGSPLEDPTPVETGAEQAAALGPVSNLDIAAPAATDFSKDALDISAAELAGGGGMSPDGDNVGDSTALAASTLFGAVGGRGHGGGGHGDGSSSKASTDFFGIGGYGQTFVYVVDASDSMNDRGKFERARYELLQSIEQLQSNQNFFVIFYNSAAYPMDAERPLAASPKNIELVTDWVKGVEPTGGTNPLPALLLALSLRPDAIYFLSDGQFDPSAVQEIRVRNRQNLRLQTKTIPIHTIAFVDRMAEGLMRTIARNSGGEYRYVR